VVGLLIVFLALLVFGNPAFAQNFTMDFEQGNLKGWQKTGNAFDYQPTRDDNPTARHRGQPSRHQGRYWVGTFEKYQGRPGEKPGSTQGDAPTGTLTSATFKIPQRSISFLIGGGKDFKTRVELQIMDPIEGAIRVKFASGQNNESMKRVTWDVSQYAGKTGRLRIVDDSRASWGQRRLISWASTIWCRVWC
jgi:hypothetical protein